MKRDLLFAFLLIIISSTVTISQERLHLDGGCQFTSGTEEQEEYSFPPSIEAQVIVSKITSAMQIQQSFILKAANVANAKASSSGGLRYILYNTTFLEQFKTKPKNSWGSYCVLAHEIGHHYNNDNFTETDLSRRKIAELSADRFAGYALQRMGATLEQAQAGIKNFALDEETSTHPPKSARMEAVATGFTQAKENTPYRTDLEPPSNKEKAAKDWFDKGFELYKKDEYHEAIKAFDKAIEYKPDFSVAYLRRGASKAELSQHKKAILDYNESIRLKPNNSVAYFSRGISYTSLTKYNEAIGDFDKAIKLEANFPEAFNNRGIAKLNLKKYEEALKDFNDCLALNPENYQAYNNRGNAYNKLNQIQKALENYAQGIKIKEDYPEAYYNMGNTLLGLGKYQEAIDAFEHAIKYKSDFHEAYNNAGIAKQKLELYDESIDYYNRAISIKPRDPSYFFNRGNAYYRLENYEKAILNYDYAIECNPNYVEAYGNQGCAYLRWFGIDKAEEVVKLIDTALDIKKSLNLDVSLSEAENCRQEALKLLGN